MNRKGFDISIMIVILSGLWCFSEAWALTGQEIARKVYDRDDGQDAFFQTEMILIDKNGNQRERLLKTMVKDDTQNLVKSYLEFLAPKDIEGTKFLSLEHKDKDDTQYLYLPELGRSRRIVSSQQTLRFVNTDFTYEDMQRRKPEKDIHTLIGEDKYLGRNVYVLESIPKSDTSQYGKRISLIDITSLVPLAIDFFNHKEKKVKEFRVYELVRINGIWTTMRVQMHDIKAGHRTRMKILSVKYNQGIEDQVFELRNLEQ